MWLRADRARSGTPLGGVAVEETGESADRVGEVVSRGQRHDAQVVRRGPVEAGAVADEDVLLPQELEHELFVVLDRVDVEIQAWEDVQRTLRQGARDPRNRVEQPPGGVA